MTTADTKNYLLEAAKAGTLITEKHNPFLINVPKRKNRSVISSTIASDPVGFILSEKYQIIEYENKSKPDSPLYFEIIPTPGSIYSIPASGITKYSTTASCVYDRIIAVSGTNIHWHIFGESSQEIQKKLRKGTLIRK